MQNLKQRSIGGRRLGAGRTSIGNDPVRTFRLSNKIIQNVDAWATSKRTSRSDAIRQLIELGLTLTASRNNSSSQRDRASQMAGTQLDSQADLTASAGDQASRKERLLKGPEEFRTARRDRKSAS
ncbi:hypothetical protein [Tardiphaga sp. 768_D3_N2_1]|uniref:hypothetical protein n=1 Tax=Tardiphaga sp. 768_D3_N2_1 TaxID=3240783 RepID=UPI003F8A9923